uniref:Uncharacterized protein n=1 Tax=Rhizophora mucronata TaxID=61149 RepID=A0A2P2KN35_RHIMU
MLAFLFQLFS